MDAGTTREGGPMLSAREGYDRAAPYYDSWLWQTFWRRNEAPLLLGMLRSLGRVRRVLDVGTGTGYYAAAMRVPGVEVVGVDVSEAMLERAHRRMGSAVPLFHADVRSLPFADGEFDVVVCSRVLSHVPDAADALREVRRVLRPSGYLVISDVDGAHDYRYTRLPTADGKVPVETYKRTLNDLLQLASNAANLSTLVARPLTVDALRWIPPRDRLRRLDRAGRHAVSFAALLRPASPAAGVLRP